MLRGLRGLNARMKETKLKSTGFCKQRGVVRWFTEDYVLLVSLGKQERKMCHACV